MPIDPIANAVDIKLACVPRDPNNQDSIVMAKFMSDLFNTQEFVDLVGKFLDSKTDEVEKLFQEKTN